MANKEHVEILSSGVQAWNQWRIDNEEEYPDLSGIDINDPIFDSLSYVVDIENGEQEIWHDLKNINFTNTILDYAFFAQCDFSNAALADASLYKANLLFSIFSNVDMSNAVFEEADLAKCRIENVTIDGAKFYKTQFQESEIFKIDMSKAQFIETNFSNASLMEVSFDNSKPQAVNLNGVDLSGTVFDGLTLDESKFKNSILDGSSFRRCKLIRADFKNAKLKNTDFNNANLTEANFYGAVLSNANVCCATMTRTNMESADVTGLVYKSKECKKLDCNGIRVMSSYGSQIFRRDAMDSCYISEFKSKNKIAHWFWSKTSNCGRSFMVWMFWSAVIAVLFGLGYWLLGGDYIKFKSEYLGNGFLAMQYYSIVTFTTLGFGDIIPITIMASVLVTIEVCLGYVMLGGLISIFASKFARRSG